MPGNLKAGKHVKGPFLVFLLYVRGRETDLGSWEKLEISQFLL